MRGEVMICVRCLEECYAADSEPFRIGCLAICPSCAAPCVVDFFCKEGHAHTHEYEPDISTSKGRSEALWVTRAMIKTIPKASHIPNQAAVMQQAKETEKMLLEFFQ